MRTLALMLLLTTLPAAAQTACTTAPAKPAGPITATGCVAPGVESKCLILTDTKTGKTYSLFFTGTAPAVGTAITFSGIRNTGVSSCMQSNPVDVKTCTIIQMSCPAPTPKAPLAQ